jgi:hypothetical protein
VTTSLLNVDPIESRPVDRRAIGTLEAPGDATIEPSPGASGVSPDTWVFFAAPHRGVSAVDHWGLGFGPTGTHLPRWSLFHRVAKDRFDSHSVFPHPHPSDNELRRWTESIVGEATATVLLESVGSCAEFYQQYFAERPDLRGRVDRE